MHGKDRIEQMSQTNTVRLGHQPEERAIAVETPGAAMLNCFEARFIVSIQDCLIDLTGWRAVDQRERFRSMPLHGDHGYHAIRDDAADDRAGLEVFEFHNRACVSTAA
jgi:hypothetical protein